MTDDGLITTARFVSEPGPLELTIEPVACGAIRLEGPGCGWVEWNRNQGTPAEFAGHAVRRHDEAWNSEISAARACP